MVFNPAAYRTLWLAGVASAAFYTVPALAQDQVKTHRFDIPVQSADAGVRAFATQAGAQILVSESAASGRRTNAVKGDYTVADGLQRLLNGTGLTATATGPSSYAVVRATETAAAEDPTEVVVTVQKRSESAQKVPVSLTVISGRTLETQHLSDLRDVSRLTPGLLVSAFSYSSPTIAIRGASNTFSQIGANKPVAVVVDDVFIPRNSAAVFDLYGLSSVQVLKGPQGTLFGRNVTGGAVLLDTGKPTLGFVKGSVRIGGGNYGLKQADGLVDLPVGENAAFRLSASLKSHDGYGYDRLSGAETDDQDSRAARAQFRYVPGDRTEVLLGIDYNDDKNGGRTLSSKAAGSDGNRRTSEVNYPQGFRRDQFGASARIYHDTPIGKLSSITGYRHSQSGEDYSGTGVSYTFLTGTATQSVTRDVDEVELLSQEVRYASPKWQYGDFVAGIYLSKEDAARKLRTRTLRAVTGGVTTDVLTDQTVTTNSYGLYADGVINLPAKLFLTVGARYTQDEKTASLVRTDFVTPASSFTDRDLKADWSEVTPRLVLTWAPTNDFRAYASVTKGYTAGGFNTDAATLSALRTPFNPETVTNKEVGVKSQWFDDRLRVNASVFDMTYDDKQELFFNNVTRVLSIHNASKARIKGLETEVNFRATDWLNLSLTYGYLDTVYKDFVIPGGAVYTGNPVASSPKNKGSIAADFRKPVGNGLVFGSLSWTSTGSYYTGAAKDANLHIESYDLTNASIGYESGPYSLLLWVRNAGDVDYVLTPSTQSVLAEYLGEPRTLGFTLSRRF
ncbi:TonB-dependent receptor [Asticcacaulis sp. BYS171W]|uniref:TonB-dependent receptor n=1 Tax=Asticcacaulis aquaticus TaxID=2984212 RepID=A0ABT5HYX7_9CAUL|nr:TonB-dependent receptor [Asticcacaulis aquaticus]MDC7685285.1 TonB-dependent receptor [Asticcacaulis aquaticus]